MSMRHREDKSLQKIEELSNHSAKSPKSRESIKMQETILIAQNPSPKDAKFLSPLETPKPGETGFNLAIKDNKLALKRLSRNDILAEAPKQAQTLKPLDLRSVTTVQPIRPLKLSPRAPIYLPVIKRENKRV
jgi:hypothetical protein